MVAAPLSDNEFERLLDETLQIAAVPAPTFKEGERAHLLRMLLIGAGADVGIDRVGNVVATVNVGSSPLVVAAHLDTVFPADVKVTPTRHADRLTGPGVADNALGLATLVFLARRLSAARSRTPLVLVATVGEEGEGDLAGARHAVETLTPSAFLALEGSGIESLITSGVASVRYSVICRTAGGHSWLDRGRPSAVHHLVRQSAELLEALDGHHINIGTLEGGTSINSLAAFATCTIDCRDQDDARLAETAAILASVFDAHGGDDVQWEVRQIGSRPGGTSVDGELAALAQEARRRVGLAPARQLGASTDANAAFAHGIPALCVGVTVAHNLHSPEEWCEIAPLRMGAHAIAALIDAVTHAA